MLYGSENWTVMLRVDHTQRVFDSRMLQKLFGPNRDKVAETLRKLHSEKLLDLYFSPDIV
jgi:putative NADH-flavin reductase